MAKSRTRDAISSSLLLFLSVDMVGSTAYKAKHARNVGLQPWLPLFSAFYTGFPREFRRQLTLSEFWGELTNGKTFPRVWKAAGDELIFCWRLTHPEQATVAVRAFRDAIREYDDILPKEISLKAAAWLAGFPITNTQIILSENEDASNHAHDDDPIKVASTLAGLIPRKTAASWNPNGIDFIGPSIDTGFRLCQLASPQRFVISIELAFMLAKWQKTIVDAPLAYHYHGYHTMKGVLDGKAYPIIWIELMKPKSHERAILDTTRCQSPETLLAFAEKSILATKGILHSPYIVHRNKKFGDVPPRHTKLLEKLRAFAEKVAQMPKAEALSKQGIKSKGTVKASEEFFRKPRSG